MRLAIVSLMGGLPWGGSEALWHALATHALQQGDEVLISVYDWGCLHEKVKALQEKGAIVHTRKRYNADAKLAERIKRFVKKRTPSLDKDYQSIVDFLPDFVFISQGDSFDLATHHKPFYYLLRQNKIPYSFVCHGHVQYSLISPKEIFPGALEVFQNAKQVFFVSKRQQALTERRLAAKISNGLFTWNPLNMQPPASPIAWPSGYETCFALVGSLSGNKGHDTAFEVLAAEKWKDRAWRLNIYGEGEGRCYLTSLAAFYGIESRICFKGYAQDILDVWCENHLLLVPSASEGLPISLVETMACGRLAVATDVGGIEELITEGKNGFMASSPATTHFARAMENAWLRKSQWKHMGENAFHEVNAKVNKTPERRIYQLLANGENSTC